MYQFNETDNNGKEMLADATDLRKELQEVSHDNLEVFKTCTEKDSLFYIYTSGTTGLPKAALISNVK